MSDVKDKVVNSEKMPINDLLNTVWEDEDFKKERTTDRWAEATKFMFVGFLLTFTEEKLEKLLNKKGWTIEDFEDKIEDYMESLFSELEQTSDFIR